MKSNILVNPESFRNMYLGYIEFLQIALHFYFKMFADLYFIYIYKYIYTNFGYTVFI